MHTSKQHKKKIWLWCLKLSRNKTKAQASNEFINRIYKLKKNTFKFKIESK